MREFSWPDVPRPLNGVLFVNFDEVDFVNIIVFCDDFLLVGNGYWQIAIPSCSISMNKSPAIGASIIPKFLLLENLYFQ